MNVECANCGCDPTKKAVETNTKKFVYSGINANGDEVELQTTHEGKMLNVNGQTMPIDLNVYDVVKALNEVGLKTLYSCENINGKGLAHIVFDISDLIVTMNYGERVTGMSGENATQSIMAIKWVIKNKEYKKVNVE